MTLSSNYGAASTYVKLASTTLTATTSTITFSNIPQGYTDLRLVICGNQYTSASYGGYSLRYNSDSGSNYSSVGMYSNTTQGTTPISNSNNASSATSVGLGTMVDFTAGSNTWVSHTAVDIMSYSNTTAYKTCLLSNSMIQSGDYSYVFRGVSTWRSTGAITALSFHAITDPPFNVGLTVNIYGVKAALVPKATGGDIVVQDGTYWYHAFRTTGAFVPRQALTADVLVVAGGGSGGNFGGAGGGAGGLLALTSQSISTAQTVTIGAGGAGVTPAGFRGNSGSDSVFGSNTATGGGGGGSTPDSGNGRAGGSGGGAGGGAGGPGTGTGGTGVSGQGFAGGNAAGGGGSGGSGGGGAGAVGANGTSSETGGNGGIGSNAYSTWATATSTGANGYYAGGGGGATGTGIGGGSGGLGGGTGGHSGTNATANTGGGGGARWNSGTSSAGGSGLVIVRYAI
jgi:hypothetical protein